MPEGYGPARDAAGGISNPATTKNPSDATPDADPKTPERS